MDFPAPDTFSGALHRVAYFARSFARQLTPERIGEYRAKNRGDELEGALSGEHRPGLHPIAWASRLAARWGVSLSGDADDERTLRVWTGDGLVRWDAVLAPVQRRHLARIVDDYAALVATFAVAREDVEADRMILASIDEPEEPAAPWVPPVPDYAATVPWHRSIWQQTAPLAHGADEKDGNITRFRTEPRLDRITGRVVEVPFLSGNSIRGQLRDLLANDLFLRLGVDPRDRTQVAPRHAHALFSGGTLDAGADTGKVDIGTRRKWRALVPSVDLLGGTVESQVMSGMLRACDVVPVCRETATQLAPTFGEADAVAWSARLPWAADLFDRRQLVRHAHREIPDDDGQQMLVHTEVIREGTTWVHLGVALIPREGPLSPVTRSCLAHALDLLRSAGAVGAGNARGLGAMVIGDYGLDTDASAYLAHIAEHDEEIRALLRMASAVAVEKPAKGAKGKPAKPAADLGDAEQF